MYMLIKDLLSYARLGSSLETELINLDEIVTSEIHQFEQSFPQVKINFTISNSINALEANRTELQLLFQNLFSCSHFH